MDFNVLPLYEEWTPPILMVRKRELDKLKGSISFSIPSNFWISGGRGLGKTLTVKKFYVPLANNMDDVYSFYFGITKTKVSDIIRGFSMKIIKRRCGDISEVLQETVDTHSGVKKFVFVFDDLQQITHMKRDFSDVLFEIYEFFKPFAEKKMCQMILVSQLLYQKRGDYLDGSVLSRFQFKPLVFSQYSKSELVELYKQRIGFVGGGDKRICSIIANEVSQLSSDFRYGLNILRESVQEHNSLDMESVKRSISRCKVVWIEEMLLGSLKPHQGFLLYILAVMSSGRYRWRFEAFNEMVEEGSSPPVAFDDLKRIYQREVKKVGCRPISDMSIWRAVESLWEKGFIDKFSLTGHHPYNYRKKRGLFVRLKEYEHTDAISSVEIDWTRQL